MTLETQDDENNAVVETQENIQPEHDEAESVDDNSESELEEVTQITFDGQELDDDEAEENGDDLDDDAETSEEEQESADDTPLVKKLRKVTRNQQKELKSIRSELERFKNQSKNESQYISEPVYPKMEDYDFDDEKHQEAVKKYTKDLALFEAQNAKLVEAYKSQLARYEEQKKALKINDFDKYQNVVINALSVDKQNLILETDKPALVVYALAKQPSLLNELSGLSKEKFIYKIAQIENKTQVNTVKKTPKTKPEKLLTNTKTGTSDSKSTEDALYKKCAETGDFTEYHKYINKGK